MSQVITSPQTIVGQHFTGGVEVQAPDVTLDNCRIEGDIPDDTLVTMGLRTKLINCDVIGSPNGQHRGVRTDGKDMMIINSRIKNIWWDIDAQAFGGWDGCNGLFAKNCELEASGEVIMFGGATMSSPDNKPQNIVIEDCFLTRKIEWRAKKRGETCKNLFELKNCKNLTLHGCTMQYSWLDGQIGYAILLTVRQDPSPYSSVENITICDNNIHSVANGISIQGRDNYSSNPKDGMVEKVLIKNNKFYDINDVTWGAGGASITIQILRGSRNLAIIGNRFNGGQFNSFLSLGGEQELKNEGLVILENHGEAGLYGIIADGLAPGVEALDIYAPGYVWDMNFIQGKDALGIKWPAGTY